MNISIEKLNLLLNTKAAIRAALVEKGQEVGDVFSTYPDKIKAIPSDIIVSDDRNGNVALTIAATTVTYNNGNVIIS